MRRANVIAMLLVSATLTSCAAAGAPTPTVSVSSGADASKVVAACLEKAGWTARVDPDGSVNVEVPKGQEGPYEAASRDCWSKVQSPTFDEESTAVRRDYYAQFLKLRSCIVKLGIDMPKPPSYQRWVDMKGAWSPYADLPMDVVQQRLPEIDKTCGHVSF